MKTKECKDHRLYRATPPGRDTGKGHKSLLSLPCANNASHTVGSAILTTCALCLCLLVSFSIGLWNCQSAVNKANFITSITSHSRLNLMALTETWIKPEDTATPAALSNHFSFSHTLRLTGRGGGTGLLISNNWTFTPLPSLSINSSFESHSVTITYPLQIPFCSCLSTSRTTRKLFGRIRCVALKLS